MIALLNICEVGDQIVAARTLYGGTHTQLSVNFKKLGIDTVFVDSSDPENFARAITPKTHLMTTLVGMGKPADGPDGDAPLTAGLARPHGIWVDPDGTVFIGDSENHRVRALK
jgi:O-acetylhomoserine/O-acetylserine sulfhydrylase-like pyridoxal-dependent enzyme